MKKVFMLASLLMLAACGPSEQATQQSTEPAPTVPPVADLITIKQFNPALSRPAQQTVTAETRQTALTANQTLAIGKLQAAYAYIDENPNFVVSPAQVSRALAMLMLGARGETYLQLLASLYISDLAMLADNQGTQLYTAISDLATQDYLAVNTATWGRDDYLFSSDYLDNLSESFNPELQTAVFQSGSDSAKAVIDWQSQFSPPADISVINDAAAHINERTRLIHAGALQLDAAWAAGEVSLTTTDGIFELKPNDQIMVPMLKASGQLPYYSNTFYEAFELALLDKPVSLLIIMPYPDHFSETINQLSPQMLADIDNKLTTDTHTVYLPLFSVQNSLPDLGLASSNDSFNEDTADFSGVNNAGYLFLKYAAYNSTFQLDATAMSGKAVSLTINQATIDEPATLFGTPPIYPGNNNNSGVSITTPPTTQSCYAPEQARPFIFILRDKTTKGILFMGKIGSLQGEPVAPISCP